MSALHLLAPDLAQWDSTKKVGALALTFFSDERPLRGATGLVDWRLSGRISRLLKAGRVTGQPGEVVLVPPAGNRLTFPRLFLFGMGNSKQFGEPLYRQVVRNIRDVLARANIAHYALQPPGRATGLISARDALVMWLEEAQKDGHDPEVSIIEPPGAQKELASTLRDQRRQGRLD